MYTIPQRRSSRVHYSRVPCPSSGNASHPTLERRKEEFLPGLTVEIEDTNTNTVEIEDTNTVKIEDTNTNTVKIEDTNTNTVKIEDTNTNTVKI